MKYLLLIVFVFSYIGIFAQSESKFEITGLTKVYKQTTSGKYVEDKMLWSGVVVDVVNRWDHKLEIIHELDTGYIFLGYKGNPGAVPDDSSAVFKPIDINSSSFKRPSRVSTSKSGCSTVRCSGYTKKGIRCKNKTTNCSGRCYLH